MNVEMIITDIQFCFCKDFLKGLINEHLFTQLLDDTAEVRKRFREKNKV